MKYHYITKLNVLNTALFISIFEFFTLLLLPYLNFNTILAGLIDGFIGAVLAIILFNSIGFNVDLYMDNKKRRLEKLEILIPSLANGIFLALLFLSQSYLRYSFIENALLRDMVVGFVNTFIAIFVCIIIYNLLAKMTRIRLMAIISKRQMQVESIDLKATPFFVAVFEFFILPMMGLFFILFRAMPAFLAYPLVGLFGGFTGSLIASVAYNFFAKRFKGIGIYTG